MRGEFELNRLEFMILDTLNDSGCKDHFHSMTITELIYRKLQKLLKAGYIERGCVDNHADTFYLLEKGIKVVEGGKEG